jgi:hypothetical protein
MSFGVIGSLRSRQGGFLELVNRKFKKRKTLKVLNDKHLKYSTELGARRKKYQTISKVSRFGTRYIFSHLILTIFTVKDNMLFWVYWL